MHSSKDILMTSRRLSRATSGILLLLISLFAVCQVSVAHAQIDAKDLSDPSLTAEERKQATLLWLDKYLTDSELMRKEDMAKIREAVAKMTPTQLDGWLKQTKSLSEYVESPQWQETKRWLKGFLRVQAIYSDKEIQQLRTEILNADADQMLAIMKRIQAKHESMTWMHQASQQTRAVEVTNRNANVAQQAAAASRSRASSTANVAAIRIGSCQGSEAIQRLSSSRSPDHLARRGSRHRLARSSWRWRLGLLSGGRRG